MDHPRSGFTLLEMMITVAIIGILAAIGIPVFTNYLQDARKTEAMDLMSAMTKGAMVYYNMEFVVRGVNGLPQTQCTPYCPPSVEPSTAPEEGKAVGDFSDDSWTALNFGEPGATYNVFYFDSGLVTPAVQCGLTTSAVLFDVWSAEDQDGDGTAFQYNTTVGAINGRLIRSPGVYTTEGDLADIGCNN